MPNTTKQSVWTCRFLFVAGLVLSGCGQQEPAQKPEPQAEAKPATPPVRDNIQEAAKAFLGTETEVLVFGELAKNGKQESLAVNRPPKPLTGMSAGSLTTREGLGAHDGGTWNEV